MKKYVIGLASPSHKGFYEKDYYNDVHEVTAENKKELEFFIEERLKRQFSLKYNIPLVDVMTLFVAAKK